MSYLVHHDVVPLQERRLEMIQMVSNEQFQEFMNQLNVQNKHTSALIVENGRKIDALLEEIQLISVPVFSVYKKGKLIKMGGTR